jgi:RimJ/RimL family protein N-acetyltransferase
MANRHWPLFDLRITTPRLELRYPSDADQFALAGLLSQGIHDPETMPFTDSWTRAESPDLERNALRFWWSRRGALVPDDWALSFAVFEDGDVVGVQDVFAKHFATTRTVTTGSWLVQRAQGHGIGKEMRAAVLHLAFAELDAVEAYTDAFEDNPASLAVTRPDPHELGAIAATTSRSSARDVAHR